MKHLSKALLLFATIFAVNASAQVQFKLIFDDTNQRYVFSIISDATFYMPDNLTGTGQMTIKVPSGAFEVANVVNLQPGMIWEPNSRSDSPVEDPEFDYISFGLTNAGAAAVEYVEGKEIPLFTFQNELGCTGAISLIDNDLDPFMPPNSRRANVGNQLTIFGAKGDAYIGNATEMTADCAPPIVVETEEEAPVATTEISLYPNPTVDQINVKVDWEKREDRAMLKIMDAAGRIVYSEPLTLNEGSNTYQINVSQLPGGSYFIDLNGKGLNKKVERFIKISGAGNNSLR